MTSMTTNPHLIGSLPLHPTPSSSSNESQQQASSTISLPLYPINFKIGLKKSNQEATKTVTPETSPIPPPFPTKPKVPSKKKNPEKTQAVAKTRVPPCSECGKQFQSAKALHGHMRCHPERELRGISRPADHQHPVVRPVMESDELDVSEPKKRSSKMKSGDFKGLKWFKKKRTERECVMKII